MLLAGGLVCKAGVRGAGAGGHVQGEGGAWGMVHVRNVPIPWEGDGWGRAFMSRQFFIVDDAPAVQFMIKDALLQAGIHERDITTFDDAQAAIEAFRKEPPDVLFMDLNMPGMDGREATQIVLGENPRQRVIIVTGLPPSNDLVLEVKSMGAFEVLHKPVRSSQVEEVLRELNKEQPGHGRVL